MKKFYGQFTPQVDRFIFERYFKDESIKGVFVECGAFDGLTECSCKFFEETMGWQGYNIEPVPWIYEKLCLNRPLSTNLNFALSDKTGESSFSAVDHPNFGVDCTNGSLNHTNKHRTMLEQDGCSFVSVPVKLLTWSDFISQNNISHIDVLVLDVEGHELSVINGMHGSDVLPDLICVEVGHLEFSEIRSSLSALGYIYDISSHVNAFFIKKESIPIFEFRTSAFNESNTDQPSISTSTISETNETLASQLNQITNLYNEVIKSKGWRFVEFVRRFRQ